LLTRYVTKMKAVPKDTKGGVKTGGTCLRGVKRNPASAVKSEGMNKKRGPRKYFLGKGGGVVGGGCTTLVEVLGSLGVAAGWERGGKPCQQAERGGGEDEFLGGTRENNEKRPFEYPRTQKNLSKQ